MSAVAAVAAPTRFVMVPDWLWDAVSATALRVFGKMAGYGRWNGRSGRYEGIRPKQETLAAACRMSLRTVQRAMDELAAAGALVRVSRGNGYGRQASVYALVVGPPPHLTGTEDAPAGGGAEAGQSLDVTGDVEGDRQPPLGDIRDAQGGGLGVTGDVQASTHVTGDVPDRGLGVTGDTPTRETLSTTSGTTTHSDLHKNQDHGKPGVDLTCQPTRDDQLLGSITTDVALVGIQRALFDGLTRAGLPATPDDARAIHRQLRDSPNVRNVEQAATWLAGHPQQLRERWFTVRRAAAADFEATRATLPPCPHGEPGGDRTHPATGVAACPLCRAGLPADRPVAAEDPTVAGIVASWAQAAQQRAAAAGGRVNMLLVGQVRTQVCKLLDAGMPAQALLDLALEAGRRGIDPVSYGNKINQYVRSTPPGADQ